jgi:lipoprotein-releasing system permease protein
MQTLLILAGTTGGVAVIVFLTQLISQLQARSSTGCWAARPTW